MKEKQKSPTPCNDKAVNDIVQTMESEFRTGSNSPHIWLKCKPMKQNLTPIEQQELKYSEKNSDLIVDPP